MWPLLMTKSDPTRIPVFSLSDPEDPTLQKRHDDFVDAIKPASFRVYVARMRRYVEWYDGQSSIGDLFSPRVIAGYVKARGGQASVSTIKGDLAAISKAHEYETVMTGQSERLSPVVTDIVRQAVLDFVPKGDGQVSEVKPLGRDLMVKVLDALDLETNAGTRDAALLTTGWGAGLNPTQLAGLTYADIELGDDGVAINLQGLASTVGEPNPVILRHSKKRWNAAKHLKRWVDTIDNTLDTPPSGLWLPINKGDNFKAGNGIKGQAINNIVKTRTEAAGGKSYTTASLKQGQLLQQQQDSPPEPTNVEL